MEYITIPELAKLNIPALPNERHLRNLAKTQNWQSRPRKGRGGGLEYLVASMPAEIQAAIAQKHMAQIMHNTPALPESVKVASKKPNKKMLQLGLIPVEDALKGLDDGQKECAYARIALVSYVFHLYRVFNYDEQGNRKPKLALPLKAAAYYVAQQASDGLLPDDKQHFVAVANKIATSYRNDWVGFMAKQPTEGKSGFFDVTVNNVLRGGLQIATESDNRYFARLMVTPAGAPNADRRVAGMTVYDTAIHTYAYGWLHEGFVRAGNGVGQEAGHQIRIGWSPQDLRLKVDLDGRDLGNFVLDQQLHTKSTVAVLTGKIAHGGTIPLPAGFTQAQCKWFVSMHNSNPANQTWDLREGGLGNHHTSNIWADGNRVVTCRVYRDVQAGAGGWQNAEANYIIIGVK